uniref:Uncharacterized protein n=1 Tax=Xiangshan martelli-like virus 4 TaxID=2886235 RepID=A0A8K1YQR4_9VIRU|nr:MAG: hypothetical protein [Xiangshan martelli-like virus 4]
MNIGIVLLFLCPSTYAYSLNSTIFYFRSEIRRYDPNVQLTYGGGEAVTTNFRLFSIYHSFIVQRSFPLSFLFYTHAFADHYPYYSDYTYTCSRQYYNKSKTIDDRLFIDRSCISFHLPGHASNCTITDTDCFPVSLSPTPFANISVCYGIKLAVLKLDGREELELQLPNTRINRVKPAAHFRNFMDKVCYRGNMRWIPSEVLSIISRHPVNLVRNSHVYESVVRLSLLNWSKLKDFLIHSRPANLINHTPKIPESFVCDEVLFKKGVTRINNTLIFPGRRPCRNYYRVNKQYLCVDEFTSADVRCPHDWIVQEIHDEMFFEHYQYPILRNTSSPYNLIDYTLVKVREIVQNFNEILVNGFGVLASSITNSVSTILDSIKTYNKKFFDLFEVTNIYLRSLSDALSELVNNLSPRSLQNTGKVLIDYLVISFNASSINSTTGYVVEGQLGGWFGNLIASALKILIDPFVSAFLDIFKEFWKFLEPLLKTFIQEIFHILVEILVTFTPIITDLIGTLEKDLFQLLQLLLTLIQLIVDLVVQLFIRLDCIYYVSEFLLLYCLISYYILRGNNLFVFVILFVLFLLIGFSRIYPSLLLEIVPLVRFRNFTCSNYSLGIRIPELNSSSFDWVY